MSMLIIFSCSEVTENLIENNFPAPTKLEVGIKNNSTLKFTRTEIITDFGTYTYQVLHPGQLSEFFEMLYVYSEAEIRIHTENGYFSFKPSHYIETTKITKGLYYFEVRMGANQTLSITRKKL
ncbi:MAG: hypothetical protein ABI295_05230 [Xanthomarina sp.]